MTKTGRMLSSQQLDRLKEHKYKAEGMSFFEGHLQPFWTWLVEQIPRTWAPNSITLWGLVGNLVTTAVLMLYCPRGYGEAPWWCYVLCAVFLFVYQALDNIDGKQARRTNSSSPLGELFDHGCDSMSMVAIVVGVSIATQVGTDPALFTFVSFLGMALFYAAQWRTAALGYMRFEFVDVTEGQMMAMVLYLANAAFGSSHWNREIAGGVKVNAAGWYVASAFGLYLFCTFVRIVHQAGGDPKDEDGKGRAAIPARYLPAVPLAVLLGLGFLCAVASRSGVVENNLVLYNVAFGLVATKLCCLVLISYMTRTDMPWLDSIFAGPLLMLAGELALRLAGSAAERAESALLWMTFAFNLVDFLRFAVCVCLDICEHLDIQCFKIKSPSSSSSSSSDVTADVDEKI